MTRISDMTPLTDLPFAEAYVPVVVTGDPTNYAYDLTQGISGSVVGLMIIPTLGAGFTSVIPDDVNAVETEAYDSSGAGGARYVYDATFDASFVSTHPGSGFVSDNDRGFRLIGNAGVVTPFMFGAKDCTGSPKLSNEVVYDCSDALDHMWSYVQWMSLNRNIALTMDWSMARGLGVSRTWTLLADDVNSIWNKPPFNYLPGRLVAMSRMVDLISFEGGNWQNLGSVGEVWGGTDTQLNASDYGARLIENGVRVTGVAGSRMGDWICQGAQRYAVVYDTANNNIPTQWGRAIAIQCGTRNTDSHVDPATSLPCKFAGPFTGTWLNHPADNGSTAQRHRINLPLPHTIDPNLIREGDMGLVAADEASIGTGYPVVVQAIHAVGAHDVTLDLSYYAPIESGGYFLGVFGGAVDMQGGNCANNSFELIEAYSCGVGVRYATLFSPKIGTLLTEATLCGVQLGYLGAESMQGISIEHFHFESVFWSIIDYATCFGATLGVASAQPGFAKMLRLVPNSISGSTWVDGGPVELRGVTFHIDGEPIHMRGISTKSKDIGGLTNHGNLDLGNPTDANLVKSVYTASGFTLRLIADQALANKSVKNRVVRLRVYGDGPGDGPTDVVTVQPIYYQPSITVNGGASVSIAAGTGALDIDCTYEPPADNSDNGNWKIIWSRMTSDAVESTIGETFTGFEALPVDPLSLSPDCYWEMARSTVYQDTGTVTPATAIDDPIGRISDLSGGTNHLTQSSAGKKPKLKRVGPLTYAQADGTDDWMVTPSFARAQPFTFLFAGLLNTDLAANSTILTSTSSAVAFQARSAEWRLITGSSFLVDGRDKKGHTTIAVFNGVSSKLYVDGQLVGTGDAGSVAIAGGLHLFVNNSEASDFVNGAFFAAGCIPGDQSASADGLHAWLAALMN